ncbi:uncharacterized protein LOC131879739 isoform X1 [Tigriopus californicus]|uniref:uncharacterized protein LOC131879739 isoform X1 n=1 Tax=Tigriopus californicus TaxID=6832 RepID=UPI0027DA3EAC|nr:uncharacterized protein LOC131879739 isoform X1 [Tigriopus californicus]
MAGRGPPYSQRNNYGGGNHTGGSNHSGNRGGGGGDLYQQLIDNNDLVRELDDIEAISQQISQHAEVLYQNWKQNTTPRLGSAAQTRGSTSSLGNNGPYGTEGSRFTSNSNPNFSRSNSSPSNSLHPTRSIAIENSGERSGSTPSYSNHNGGPVHSAYNPYRDSTSHTNTLPTRLHHQIAQAQQQSTGTPYSVGSTDFSSRSSTLPNRGSSGGRSITQIKSDFDIDTPHSGTSGAAANGNLKDLVNSFVSTDRAKQAARNTISSTITNMRNNGNGNGLRSPSPSSSTSSFGSRGMSPLKSPMLAISSVSSPTGPLSPTSSITSSYESQRGSTPRYMPTNDIHTQLTPMFGGGGGGSGSQYMSQSRDTLDRPALRLQPPSSGWNSMPISSSSTSSSGRVISIPVQHLTATASTPSGLQSPKVLQTISSNSAPAFPRRSSNRNSLEFDMPLPSLHAANVERMKLRFEEAKQRMNLMHQRAMESDVGDPEIFMDLDDGSNLILDQLRRRSARREIPSAPHPELTPQQKQHIMERSSQGPNSTSSFGSSGFPFRRFLGGGSVAERVLIFERCPVFQTSDSKDDGFKTIPIENRIDPAGLHRKSAPELSFINSGPTPPLSGTSPPQSQIASPVPSFRSSSLSSPSVPTTSPQIRNHAREVPVAKGSPVITPVLSKSPPSANPVLSPIQPTFTTTVLGSRSITPPKVITPPPPLGRPRSLVIEGTAASKGRSLPKFHFPFGNPALSPSAEASLKTIQAEFRKYKSSCVSQEDLGQILKKCGFPISWKGILFNASGGDKVDSISYEQFARFWRKMSASNHDDASQFAYILTRGLRRYLVPEDFVPLIQDVVDTHPGLGFLKEATEFHSRYVHTVIARIFFCVNRSWSGKITIPELRRSNFLPVLRLLEEEEDINQVTDFFSYEHFYVIYCKFWELDKDHDLFIDREDLSRHNDHGMSLLIKPINWAPFGTENNLLFSAISTRMIDRIFSGAVTRGQAQKEGKMSYTEFVWFLLAEEDKRHPTSIEYWFRCMDLDGDGFLSMYEIEYFYEEQLQRMEQLMIETLPFEDCLCQMLDMIMPDDPTKISLRDLRTCRMTPIFFDTFFNLEKYLEHEQRDPFASQRDVDEDGNEISDWDRFAAEEYELLVAEEGHAEVLDDMGYEDDENSAEMNFEEALEDAAENGKDATAGINKRLNSYESKLSNSYGLKDPVFSSATNG